MKSLKVLSIIGIVLYALFLLGIMGDEWNMNNVDDWDALQGGVMIASAYGLALSIVGVLKSKNKNNE